MLDLVGNHKVRFSCVAAHFYLCLFVCLFVLQENKTWPGTYKTNHQRRQSNFEIHHFFIFTFTKSNIEHINTISINVFSCFSTYFS